MATISIAGNTLIGCLGVGSFTGIGTAMSLAQRTANSLTQTLSQLRGKVNVAAQAADVSAASAGSSRALAREERKEGAISLAYKKLDWLLSDAAHVDNQAAGAVEQLKKDFYKQYGYLKPECEKSRREKIKDAIKGAWDGLCEFGSAVANFVCDAYEWCKEHLDVILKAIAVVVLLVVSVVLLATGVGGILAAACWGCIFGIVGGLLTNGISNVRNGKGFFEGALDAMLIGGIGGAVGGAIGGYFAGSMPLATNMLQAVWRGAWTNAIASGGSSFVTSTIQYFAANGTNGSAGEYFGFIFQNVAVASLAGGVMGGITGGISFKIGEIRTNSRINKELAAAEDFKDQGARFEKMGHDQIQNNPQYAKSDSQITMKIKGGTAKGGTTIKMDEVAVTKDGQIINFEYKSSETAPFTNSLTTKGGGQTNAYVNNNFRLSDVAQLTKKGFNLTGETFLPKNMPVTVVRPSNFVSVFGTMQDGVQKFFQGFTPGVVSGFNAGR